MEQLKKIFRSKIVYWTLTFLLSAGVAAHAYHQGRAEGRRDGQAHHKAAIQEFDKELGAAETRLATEQELHRVTEVALGTATNSLNRALADIEEKNLKLAAFGEAIAKAKSSGKGKVVTKYIKVPKECGHAPEPEAPGEDPPDPPEDFCAKYGFSDWRIDAVVNGCTDNYEYHLSQTFRVQLLEATDHVGNMSTYLTLEELGPNGEVVTETDIEDFKVTRISLLTHHMDWWSPHVDLGIFSSLSVPALDPAVGGSLGFSFAGYGLTPDDQEYRVGRISLEMRDTLGLGIAPAGFNLGKIGVPLITDLWLWPTYTYHDSHSIGLVLSTTL